MKMVTAAHCIIDTVYFDYNGDTYGLPIDHTDPFNFKYFRASVGVHNRRYLNDSSAVEIPISEIIIVIII